MAKKLKRRFKVTIEDRKTGDKDVYLVYDYGFQKVDKAGPAGPIVTKIVLDYPKVKTKKTTVV